VDKRARHAALNGSVFDRALPHGQFSGFGQICFANKMAEKVYRTMKTLVAIHSILLKVSFRRWFEDLREDRKFVFTVSRIMSGH
jgi:hypothetical protein